MAVERQSSTLPPAQPSYILRGHASQIHSVQFVRQNARLLTGDADGWIVYWKLETKRALAVWKAHDGAILGTTEWGHNKIITHGRDNNLRIWQMRRADESSLSTVLPAEATSVDRPKPWLLHTLPVNTLNFCAFSMCYEHLQEVVQNRDDVNSVPTSASRECSILVAVPARDDKKAEVYQFPDERLRYVVPRVQTTDTGMIMAVKLARNPVTQRTMVITGYESGVTAVHLLPAGAASIDVAELVYLSKPHTQPILSLDVTPDIKTYFTSGADAVVAAHRIPDFPAEDVATNSPTSAQQFNPAPQPTSNHVVADVHVAEEAIDDPPHSVPDDPPHSIPHDSTSDLSFGKRPITTPQPASQASGLSSLLSTAPTHPRPEQPPLPSPTPTIQSPYKLINTKHAGQQSLTVRSDDRILATGGWDARVRIYSTKTLREVAVLKWHKEGIYAVAFSQILSTPEIIGDAAEEHGGGSGEVARRETGLGRLQRQREERMQVKHWVAAGAKDGKVSLWEVF